MVALLFSYTSPLHADDAKRKLDVFEVSVFPWLGLKTAAKGSEKLLIKNRIPDCLKGEVYDVRESMTRGGIEFKDGDFAWYSPKSELLVVNTSAENMELVEVMISSCGIWNPVNATLNARVSISRPAGANTEPTELMKCSVSASSGAKCTISKAFNSNFGYSFECEPIVGPDGQTVECSLAIRVTYKGQEYSMAKKHSVSFGRPSKLLLGTTPDERKISFILTFNRETVVDKRLSDDPNRKAELIRRITKDLLR